MKVATLSSNSFAWRLEASVWATASRDPDEALRCRPSLTLVHRSWEDEQADDYSVLGHIHYEIGNSLEPDAAWLVFHRPENSSQLGELVDETAQGMISIVEEGVDRSARQTAKAAITLLLDLTKDQVPRAEHAALTKIADNFLRPLEQMTSAYVRHFKKPTAKSSSQDRLRMKPQRQL